MVYKIPCGGNRTEDCDLTYIGTTKQFLKNRLLSHKSDIKCNNSNKTALTQHAVQLEHIPDFLNTEIIAVENNASKRYILESLHIQTTEKVMNRKTDVDNISDCYRSLLNKFKTLLG